MNNATVLFQAEDKGTYAGNMTGDGALILRDLGIINLNGTNSLGTLLIDHYRQVELNGTTTVGRGTTVE